jgi:hypothetical protein
MKEQVLNFIRQTVKVQMKAITLQMDFVSDQAHTIRTTGRTRLLTPEDNKRLVVNCTP